MGPVRSDPILSQLEQPRLTGEDFAGDQMVTINSVIAENYILIEAGGNPPELYAIEDRQQERNLAGQPGQRSRLERMRSTLATLRAHPVICEPPASLQDVRLRERLTDSSGCQVLHD